jgi:hypothetical protein
MLSEGIPAVEMQSSLLLRLAWVDIFGQGAFWLSTDTIFAQAEPPPCQESFWLAQE